MSNNLKSSSFAVSILSSGKIWPSLLAIPLITESTCKFPLPETTWDISLSFSVSKEEITMATLYSDLKSLDELEDSNKVKILVNDGIASNFFREKSLEDNIKLVVPLNIP